MKTEELFRQRINLSYAGKAYYANPAIALLGGSNSMTVVNELPYKAEHICDFIETDNEITLQIGYIVFNVDEEENGSFDIQIEKEIKFDKATLKATGDKLTVEDCNTNGIYQMILLGYIDRVCKNCENVYKYVSIEHKYLNGLLYHPIMLKNFINMISFNLLEFEKLINSNNCKILETSLSRDDFELKEASKLHQVIGLPKFALSIIKDLKLEFALEEIKVLSESIDGNSLKLVFEMFDNMKILLKSDSRNYQHNERVKKFILDFAEVAKKGYRTADLINYLLRQNFYFSQNQIFTFPFAEVGFLKDYIHMSETYMVKVDKYPSQLKKQHDILAKNCLSLEKLSPELEKQFAEAVDKYKEVEKEITITLPLPKGAPKGTPRETVSYSFIVPRCIKDIIQEGNDLHHCVGSWSDKIINEQARIVFMRLSDKKKESLVTIDIGEDYSLVEAAGNANCELNDEQTKALNAWLKEIKK